MAGYVTSTLATGEEILHRANFNWTYSFFPVMWFAIGLSPVSMVAVTQYAGEVPMIDLQVAWWSAGAAAFIGSWILLSHLIHLMTTEIVVTSFRFVYKTGLVSRATQEVSLNKIEETTLNQSVWGRIFGYGQLILRGTGVGVIEDAKASLRKTNFDDRADFDD